eukprot:6425792-Lingulodinium_polyedra.AAC.1
MERWGVALWLRAARGAALCLARSVWRSIVSRTIGACIHVQHHASRANRANPASVEQPSRFHQRSFCSK